MLSIMSTMSMLSMSIQPHSQKRWAESAPVCSRPTGKVLRLRFLVAKDCARACPPIRRCELITFHLTPYFFGGYARLKLIESYRRITPMTLCGYVPKFSSSSWYCPVFLSRFISILAAAMKVPLPLPLASRMSSITANG